MKILPAGVLGLALLVPVTARCQTTSGPVVRFHTNLGDIDVTMLPNFAPKTVDNFLNYMRRGAFDNSIIHRSVKGFIIQGGGYQLQNHAPVAIPPDPPVRNEFSLSNTRGTIAMAKTDGDPNSATNQWFFNLADNSKNLNSQNGGFTVFGRIANSAGLAVMDKVAAVPTYQFESPFNYLPLLDYTGGQPADQNYVIVLSMTQMESPKIDGIVTASGFGGSPSATAGSFIEIYGSNLAGSSRGWAESDFKNGNAPTNLDGVTVTVNGRSAFVTFVSATQVNVQLPAIVPSPGSVPVIVSYNGQASAPVMLPVKPLAGGLLAPASFKVDGKQYAAAIHWDTQAFVSNGRIPDIPAAPAVPGETLVFYGVGFGPVDQSSTPIAGQVVQGSTVLSTPVEFSIGPSAGQVRYAGYTPGLVGVYQFNVTIPLDTPSGDQPLVVVQGGEAISQTLFLSVR